MQAGGHRSELPFAAHSWQCGARWHRARLEFDGPFRIVQDAMIDASRDAETALKDQTQMAVAATLDYQACDDRICFNPQSVPLSWIVRVRTLDRERVK